MLNYEFPPLGGGAANANYYLLKELSKKGLKIDLITSSENKFCRERFSKDIWLYKLDVNKKKIHYWSIREILLYSIKAARLIKKLKKKNNYCLIHEFFPMPCGLLAINLDNKKNLPVVISLRGSDVPGFNPRFKKINFALKPLFKHVCANADSVVSNSSGLKELAKKSWNGSIEIIPNGIDISEFSPDKKAWKKKFNKNKGRKGSKSLKIITVARLIKRKGLNYLIEAMKCLKNIRGVEGIDARLIIIGKGPEKDNLIQLAKKCKCLDKITFKGYVKHSELPKYYNEADVFVLPSLFEGMPNTILEAMACGLPIVTTNTGGSSELINNNGIKNGIIIKKKSAESIANAIADLANNKKRLEFSKNSRKIALKYSWKSAAEKYYSLYLKNISKHK